jgi:hypothetical protein
MHTLECKIRVRVAFTLTAVALAIAGCSGGKRPQGSQDGGPDDAPAECAQMQRDYVNRVLAPDQQTDVAATVNAVLGGSDFPQAMPYCSGARPGNR